MSISKLDSRLESEMALLSQSPNLARVMAPGFVDRRLYAMYLVETYHYTRHNSRNQAVVATRAEDLPIRYMKYCLKHAMEEAGHEMMAFHDLKAMGYSSLNVADLPAPLQETDTLIAYLYRVAAQGEPLARLGYSYWAERSYEFIQPLLQMVSGRLEIPKKAMTFFEEHSEIDEKHAKEVAEVIQSFAETPEDWAAIEDTMVQSLKLTTRMMDAVLEEFIRLKETGESRYGFIK